MNGLKKRVEEQDTATKTEFTALKKRCSDIDGKMDGEGGKSQSAMDVLKERLDALTAKTDDLQTKLQQKDEQLETKLATVQKQVEDTDAKFEKEL